MNWFILLALVLISIVIRGITNALLGVKITVTGSAIGKVVSFSLEGIFDFLIYYFMLKAFGLF